MTGHDQFFKKLLREFFGDLLRIVTPELAAHLKLENPTFVETEVFTSFPEGDLRRMDLVALVDSVQGEPELVLVHVEVQGQARRTMARRLLDYSLQLWLLFRYRSNGPIASADLTDRQRYLLTNCVGTYIEWNTNAQQEYEGLLAEKGNEMVAILETTWADRLRQEGHVEGREEGRVEGREEGRRDLVLELLEVRFGRLPEGTLKRVQAITSSEELSRLAVRILEAPSLDDLGP